MSQGHWQNELRIPVPLTEQLREFRRRVWTIKLAEALAIAGTSVLAAFLAVFVLDRLFDSPAWLRAGVGIAALVGCAVVPWFVHRWLWSFRRLEQLARLLSRKLPGIGDQLLGILELAHNRWEQTRSLSLCQAAIEQVSDEAKRYDFRTATPQARVVAWGSAFLVLASLTAVASELAPEAATNTWARFTRPWATTPRYTFAALEPLPAEMIVAHGEPITLNVKLSSGSRWQPASAKGQIASQPAVATELADGGYQFEFPPQIEANTLQLRIGDATAEIRIEPKLRPELVSIVARNELPEYLGQPGTKERDVRGGVVSLVKGSRVSFVAAANRSLKLATVGGQAVKTAGEQFSAAAQQVDDSSQMTLEWEDDFGLACKSPFRMAITALDDEAPQLACEDLPRGRVVLDTEQLKFHVRAHDDFGVRNVGMTWRGIPSEMTDKPAKGEAMLGAGGYDRAAMEVDGTFTAKSLGIEPQPIELRLFVTDYYPDRKPVYSAPYTIFVLNAEMHAIWVTEQMARWHRQALEVRDRELALYETNKRLRAMSPAELDKPNIRKQIEQQADAERTNGRRLANLTESGKELLRQAARNPEIGVGHLDKWAEMLQILGDISANRMPSVADLLKDASQAKRAAVSAQAAKSGPMAGKTRASGGTGESQPSKPVGKNQAAPRVVDSESSQQPNEPMAGADRKNSKPSASALRLPVTTVAGQAKPGKKSANQTAEETVDEAVTEQRDLLAEFQKVADELNNVLANLEGSTLMKRLKVEARRHYDIAGSLDGQIEDVFGTTIIQPGQVNMTPEVAQMVQQNPEYAEAIQGGPPQGPAGEMQKLSKRVDTSIENISYIMDDMAAYFERRRMVKFKLVLDDMRQQDILGGLQQLSDDLPREHGLSISQSEYWSDTLDRWAEDLVDPACSGACPGCRSKGSLPPSIVLEVLQILEGEVNLREETRVAEQARAAIEAAKHETESNRLSGVQQELDNRVVNVVERIQQLPDGAAEFGKEIALLSKVSGVMQDATKILASHDTGAPAVAAETEAIELLLQSKRINPKGGGGGGANPGGGGGGTTQDSALALLGPGVNQKEVRETQQAEQATGATGNDWPEEYRAGLDQYFSRLENP